MISANLTLLPLNYPEIHTFKRRQSLPTRECELWRIESGAIRTFTWAEDGIVVPLGFWGVGDIVGPAISRIQPYQMECLSEVKACCFHSNQFWRMGSEKFQNLDQVMLEHIHQMQELLRIRSGEIPCRLQNLLQWLAKKFGRYTQQGQLIELWLTHQDIADAIGATRVTVTRWLHEFERQGLVNLSCRQNILINYC